MEKSRILGIFILVALAVALTIGIFGRKRKVLPINNVPAPTRADYTLSPPFLNPFESPDGLNGLTHPPVNEFSDLYPPPPPQKKGCGCGMKK